jgi:hypothetical protein
MTLERLVWLGFRTLYYGLLFLLLIGVIFLFARDLFLAGTIILAVFTFVLYKGLICIKIPAYSLVVREGKVVFFIPEKTVRNRFDFVSRGQTIVELPHYGLLERPYKFEIVAPDNDGSLYSCRLSLYLDYNTEPAALQRAYDSIILHQEKMSLEVRKLLLKSSECLECKPAPMQSKEDMQEYLRPLVAELNLGLDCVGLKIEEAKCALFTGSRLVRFVAAEQEIVEKAISMQVQAQ